MNIDDLTAKWEPRLRDEFLAAVQRVRDRVNISAIERLIKEGRIEEAIDAVGLNPLDFSDLSEAIADAFNEGGKEAAKDIPANRSWANVVSEFRFDVRNLTAEDITRTQSSTLVTEINEDLRQAIRQHLTAGVEAGANPRQTALELVGRKNPVTGQREGGIIGLTSQQETWQRSYAAQIASSDPSDLMNALGKGLRNKRYDAAIKRAIATGKPIPVSMRENMIRDYRNKTLKYRADVISRNETIKSLAASQREAYRQSIEAGHVKPEQIKRFWVTAGDDRVRNDHRLIPGMNKGGVQWGEPFKVPFSEDASGLVMNAPHGVQCRCRERIVVDYFIGLRKGLAA